MFLLKGKSIICHGTAHIFSPYTVASLAVSHRGERAETFRLLSLAASHTQRHTQFGVLCHNKVTLSVLVAASSGEFHCSFEEEPICMFSQDQSDNFDWTRHSAATRDTKYTPNTGPSGDRSGSKQGEVAPLTTSHLNRSSDRL